MHALKDPRVPVPIGNLMLAINRQIPRRFHRPYAEFIGQLSQADLEIYLRVDSRGGIGSPKRLRGLRIISYRFKGYLDVAIHSVAALTRRGNTINTLILCVTDKMSDGNRRSVIIYI